MSSPSQWALVALLLAVVLIGAVWLMWQDGSARRRKRRKQLPQQLPVRPRPVLNRIERQIWLWLRQVFPGHQILIKLPLTRFTMPRHAEDARTWFPRLSTVYSTFALCDETGHIVACVDVLGERRLPRGNRQLKRMLLTQCQIGYAALSPEALPDPWTIRAEFLGAGAAEAPAAQITDWTDLQNARDHLVEALDRNRNFRRSQQVPLEPLGRDTGPQSLTDWSQPDSLRTPLEAGSPHPTAGR